MRSFVISIAIMIAGTALALPPLRPVLPPVAHDDTETITNVPFAAWQDSIGKFKFSLKFLPSRRKCEFFQIRFRYF